MSATVTTSAVPSPSKAVADTFTIAYLHWQRVKSQFLFWTVLLTLFPLAMLFFARYLVPPGVELTPRLIAGSIVFNLGISIVQGLANDLGFLRFTFRTRLIQVCPVHPYSYAFGSLIISVLRALIMASMTLLFAPLFGISIQLSPWFLPVAACTALSLAGLAFLIATWAPTQELANMTSTVLGVLIVMISPIYFPASRLPDWMEVIAHFSPYLYAANAFDAILSGRGGFYDDLAILAVIMICGLAIGLAGMRWREV